MLVDPRLACGDANGVIALARAVVAAIPLAATGGMLRCRFSPDREAVSGDRRSVRPGGTLQRACERTVRSPGSASPSDNVGLSIGGREPAPRARLERPRVLPDRRGPTVVLCDDRAQLNASMRRMRS